jgi:hypothetical protein
MSEDEPPQAGIVSLVTGLVSLPRDPEAFQECLYFIYVNADTR